jgi:hypothetical protein
MQIEIKCNFDKRSFFIEKQITEIKLEVGVKIYSSSEMIENKAGEPQKLNQIFVCEF